MRSIAQRSFAITGLFEAEVLVKLILDKWSHPFATDTTFADELLESAAEALQLAISGQDLIEGLPAEHTNLIAAMWYVEWSALTSGQTENATGRQAWLECVKRSLPSCFCDPQDLTP